MLKDRVSYPLSFRVSLFLASRSRLLKRMLAVSVICSAFASALADTHTWTGLGTSDNWSDAANWDLGLPVDGDNLTFDGTVRQSNANDLLTSVGNIVIVRAGFAISGAALTINGTFGSTGVNSWSIPLTLTATGHLFESLNGTLTISGDLDTAGNTVTFKANYGIGVDGPILVAGIVSGEGGVTKEGTGTVTLTRDNTYSGFTTLSKGYLAVSSDNNLGTVPGEPTLNIKLNGGYLQASASFTINSNRLIRITINSTSTGLWADSGVTLTYDGVIGAVNTSYTYGLWLDGEGTIALSGENTYMGNTTIFALYVRISNAKALGSGTLSESTVLVNNLSTLQLTGGVAFNRTLKLDLANLVNLSGNNSWAGEIHTLINPSGKSVIRAEAGTKLTINASIYVNTDYIVSPVNQLENLYLEGAGDIDITGSINGLGMNEVENAYILGHGDVVMDGTGTLTLSGGNTYSGRTIVNSGVISVGADGNLGVITKTAPGRIVLSGGTLLCSETFTLGVKRGIALGPVLGSGTGTVNVAANKTVTYAGIITNSTSATGCLKKAGTGTLTVTGASTYTGGTIVDAGTLKVNNTTGSGTGTGWVTVSSGGTLAGSGFIGGITELKTGGTLSPGNSPGTITIYTNLVLEAGSTFAVEINGVSNDLAAVTGTCTIASGALLSVSGVSPTAISYTIITAGSVTGTFSGYPEGAPVAVADKTYCIHYGAAEVILYLPGTVHGYVFNDKGETPDMLFGAGDSAITGAVVRLYVNAVYVTNCVSVNTGFYEFTGVPPGTNVALKITLDSGTLTGVPTGGAATNDVTRNRATSAGADAVISSAVASAQGVSGGPAAETLNFGFIVKPVALSTAMDVSLDAEVAGIFIRLWTVNESGCDDIVIYAWIGDTWVEVGRVPAGEIVGEGANPYRVLASGLTAGNAYSLKIVDEAGHVHYSSAPVTVQAMRVAAVRLDLQTLTLTFNTESGRSYVVAVSTDLVHWSNAYLSHPTADGWSAYVDTPFTAGTGTQTQVRVPVNGRKQAFFKIVRTE